MTTPDPTAVLTAALRVSAHAAINIDNATIADRNTLSLAYLALTDPTPLTVERLVEMGGVWNPPFSHWSFKNFYVELEPGGGFSFWTYQDDICRPTPRTVGELRQLLNRLG